MKQLLLAMLTIAGLGCAVDTGPQLSPLDDGAAAEASSSSTSPDITVSPHLANCYQLGEECDFRENCIAEGGTPTTHRCSPNWADAVCCILPLPQ